jgi:hypothetical protein
VGEGYAYVHVNGMSESIEVLVTIETEVPDPARPDEPDATMKVKRPHPEPADALAQALQKLWVQEHANLAEVDATVRIGLARRAQGVSRGIVGVG